MKVARLVVILAVLAYVTAGIFDPDLVPDWLKFTPPVGCIR
jgi:hypothetical protein